MFGDTIRNYSLQYDLYEQFFIEWGLFQKVNEVTRLNNILDYVMCTDKLLITNLKVSEPFSSSDHNRIVFCLNIQQETILNEKIVYKDFINANYNDMNAFLETIDWENILCIEDNSIDNLWENFVNILDYAIYLFVPFKKINLKKKMVF